MHKMDDRLNDAADVIQEIMHTPDKGIPERHPRAAQSASSSFPTTRRVPSSSAHSTVRVSPPAARARGWSAPVFVKLEGGSFGWQIGGQSTDLVLVAMN